MQEVGVSAPKPRLDHLREMISGAEDRMLSDSCTDQNYAVLGRFRRDLLAEVEDLGGAGSEPKETGLSDFEKRLRERESGAKVPRKAKSS